MHAAGHQADIAKTYENRWYLLILEGRRLANAHFGRLGELLAGFLQAWGALGWVAGGAPGWQLAGWLVGCLVLAGWLAGHRDPRS